MKHKFSIPAQSDPRITTFMYSVRLDQESAPLVWQQIRSARKLYNDIIAFMRQTYDETQVFILDKAGDEAKNLNSEIEDLNKQFKIARADQDDAGMIEIAQLRLEKRRVLSGLLKEVRANNKNEVKAIFFDKIGLRTSCGTYQIRCQAVNESNLGWGTANDVLARAIKAFQSRIKVGQPPKFAIGSEKLQDSLWIQFTQAGGEDIQSLLSGECFGFALRVPDGGAGRRKYGEFRFRLGSAKNKDYATGTFYYNRPIPEGSKIVSVALTRKRIGSAFKYSIQLVTELPEKAGAEKSPKTDKFCSLYFGWARGVGDEKISRNFMALADQGNPNEARLFFLPESIEADLARVKDLKSERSQIRNDITQKIKQGEIEIPFVSDETANDFEAIKRLPATYISPSRVHRLCHQMIEAKIPRPDGLEKWRLKDRALHQNIAFIRRRALFRRRDFYRVTACEIARKYQTIVIRSLDLKKAMTRLDTTTGEKSDINKKSRTGQRLVALYELKTSIMQAAAKEGCVVIEIKGEKTATTCAYCGKENLVASQEDWHLMVCPDCGAKVIRKKNGAAVAWQFAAPVIDDLVDEARSLAAMQEEKRKILKSEKTEKAVAARAKNRAARERQDATGTPGGSRA